MTITELDRLWGDGHLWRIGPVTHTGYIRIGGDTVEDYRGRYGEGWVVRRHKPQARKTHTVLYYVKKEP